MSLLGKTVKDSITGLKGVAIQEMLSMSGNHRYTVQPVSEDPTKVLDSWTLDAQGLEVVEYGNVYPVVDKVPTDIKVGDEVVGIISKKHSGFVTSLVTYMNGCTSAHVINKEGEENWVAVQLLKNTSKNLNIPQTKTGGPATKATPQGF